MNEKTSKLVLLVVLLSCLLAITGFAADGEKSSAQLSVEEPAAGIVINWQVISSGGGHSASASYSFESTFGQPAVGTGSSVSYRFSQGFWHDFGCCVGIRGNVNGDPEDQVNVADLTYMVDYLFRGGTPPLCEEEGDVNGDTNTNVADLTYVIDYLFRGGPAPPACP